MTSKIYKTAQGKTVDLGTIMLQNEHTRAVGNMNVNARGDLLDSNNQVIETKSRQVQKQNAKTTNVSSTAVHTSTRAAKRAQTTQPEVTQNITDTTPDDSEIDLSVQNIVTAPAPVSDASVVGGGLAAAIAKSKVIKQEKEKTARELQQSQPGVRKI